MMKEEEKTLKKRRKKSGWDRPAASKDGSATVDKSGGNVESIEEKMPEGPIVQQNTHEIVRAAVQGAKTKAQFQAALLTTMSQSHFPIANRIYVGSLPYELKENDIRTYFSSFGTVASIDLSHEPNTSRSKGFCFLEYTDPLAAECSVQVMNGVAIAGRTIKVGRPNAGSGVTCGLTIGQQATLNLRTAYIYISGVVPGISQEQIESVFGAFGEIKRCEMPRSIDVPTSHRGYCFIQFPSEDIAEEAIKHMHGFELAGQRLKVGKASSAAFSAPVPAHSAIAAAQAAARAAAKKVGLVTGKTASLAQEENMTISSSSRIELMKKLSRKGDSASTSDSRCILLLNMVKPSEVDGELKGEVREECSKHGAVEEVAVHVVDDVVRIFVLFKDTLAAKHAVDKLDQRYFGGRLITTRMFDVEKFRKRELSE